jgi:cytidylate kinase
MAKVSLSEPDMVAGPFLTISRQYGCYGFSLGLLLLEVLNDEIPRSSKPWKVYHKEILQRLADETHFPAELLDKERRAKPRLFLDFFRFAKEEDMPTGWAIRHRITSLIRKLAIDGRAIIVGQGGAGATQDLPRGLSIRLDAPLEWRVKEIAVREGIPLPEARLRVRAKDRERAYLEKVYARRFPGRPAFNLRYDSSAFTLAQIAQHIVYAMKLRGVI